MLVRAHAGALERHLHAAEGAVAVLGRRGDVVGVAGHAVADDLGVDLRAALLGVLEFLEHDDAGALAHDEAVAVLVPRPRRLLRRVVEAASTGARGGEAGDAEPADRRLGAAGDHHVGIVPHDHPRRVADRVRAGGAGGDHRMVGPLEAVADRDMAAGEVDQRRRNEERAELAASGLSPSAPSPWRSPAGRRCRSRSARRCAAAPPRRPASSRRRLPPARSPPCA